jgi:hypothetical protein
LNLWKIVFWDLVFYLASQRTLNLDEESVLRDPIGRPSKKGVLGVLDKTNLMGLPVGPGIIQVTGNWLQESAVSRCGIPGPRLLQDLFGQEIIGFFVTIVA